MRSLYNDYFDRFDVRSTTNTHLQTFVQKVFFMMFIGLGVTALISFITLQTPALLKIAINFSWILFFAEIGIVFYLAGSITRMNPQKAYSWFLGYSALNGVALSPIFLIYTGASISSAFLISGGMFGAMALWGATTKKDLTSLGALLFMGLIGIMIASIVNIFLHNSGLQLIISYAGVAIFTGLTAWDTQRIKQLYYSNLGRGSLAVLGALQLYLDFINLFMHVLFILGGRKSE